MDDYILISQLNDFIFCPRSIYFHNIFGNFDESLYHTTYQTEGRHAHNSLDEKRFSSKSSILQGIDVFSEELGIIGKIDLYDMESKELIERKKKIKKIYEGYYLQLYAQFLCMKEMGYNIENLSFYSLIDNKKIRVNLPGNGEKKRLYQVIYKMRNFDLEDPGFKQNPEKCKMCIYNSLCDYYQNDIKT